MQYVMRRILVVALVATLVVSCGGGGGGSLAGIDRLGVTNGTITGFGSIIVNGIEYQTGNSTSYDIDDDPAGLPGSLQVGQNVTVRWSSSDNGATRRADAVVYDDTVEGPVTTGSISTLTSSFVVLGQTVLVDADTSFGSPLFDLASLADGDVVKVSGLFDGDGVIRATRIDREAPGGQFEIRGVVANRDATTFTINGQVVNTATATIDAPGGVISDGDFVEAKGTTVNGTGQLVATKVEFEDGQTRVGEAGEDAEIEGYVDSQPVPTNTAFSVGGVPVLSSVTPNGVTIVPNMKVRVEGEFNASGAIVASEVSVRSGASGSSATVRIAANVDSVNASAGQIVVLGVTVQVNANTRLEDQSAAGVRSFTLAALQVGDFVEVRGVAGVNNSLTATLLQRQEPDVEGSLRGPIGTLSNPDFTILGVTVQTDDFTQFEGGVDFFGGAATVDGRPARAAGRRLLQRRGWPP
ncbi:MAG: DUF5666 domain-containing protein, partial [Gammaproteobacteria bacterium]